MAIPASAPFLLDGISEQRLKDVYPVLAQKIRQMAQVLQSEGTQIRVVQGLRTWAQQDALYAQGRTTKGNIITNVPGGSSWHCFGLAVDCVPAVNGITAFYVPDWDSDHPTWKRMEALGVGLGLQSGATWKRFVDAPHFQISGPFAADAPDDEVRQIFKQAGMEAVWAEIDKANQSAAPANS